MSIPSQARADPGSAQILGLINEQEELESDIDEYTANIIKCNNELITKLQKTPLETETNDELGVLLQHINSSIDTIDAYFEKTEPQQENAQLRELPRSMSPGRKRSCTDQLRWNTTAVHGNRLQQSCTMLYTKLQPS